ncbi:MAG: hypothetical protein M1348_03660 [Candidatus Parvarchaeota archaeon]|nr:hypothetical protein [Candidatus Parvarchaeota archaeon]MCL5101676.1 hypothetical protein [Candidatus Parvarchaeota archaeon]
MVCDEVSQKKSLLERLLEPKKKTGPSKFKKNHPALYKVISELAASGNKLLKFTFSAATLGVMDSFGPEKYINFTQAANYLSEVFPARFNEYLPILTENGLYQTLLFTCDLVLAAWSLHDNRWRRKRNLLNLPMAIPHSIIMDYMSAAIQDGNPDPLPLKVAYFGWRIKTFSHTIWGGIAQWVDEPSRFIPGAIQGYDLLIYVSAAYIATQLAIGLVKHQYISAQRKE